FAETRDSRKADLMQMRGGKNSNTVGVLDTFVFVLSSAAVAAAQNTAPPLSPTNIFAPASAPAESIFGLSMFVLSVTAAIFVVVFSLLAYSAVKFRTRNNDHVREPAQLYVRNPVEITWTDIPIHICLA